MADDYNPCSVTMKAKLTPEQRSAIAKARDAKLTPEQLSARGKRLNAAKLSKYSSRDLSAFSKKAAKTRWAKPEEHDAMGKTVKAQWDKLTPEQRSARAKKSAAKVTQEQRRARGIKGKAAFMAKHPPEERSAIAKKAAAKKNSQTGLPADTSYPFPPGRVFPFTPDSATTPRRK